VEKVCNTASLVEAKYTAVECDDPWKLMPKINGKTIAVHGVYHHPDWESAFLDSTGRSADWIILTTFREDVAVQIPSAQWIDGKRMSLIGRVTAIPKFDGGYSMSLGDIEFVTMDPP
jgi:hypothetical protein